MATYIVEAGRVWLAGDQSTFENDYGAEFRDPDKLSSP